jgi:hypothetical protein
MEADDMDQLLTVDFEDETVVQVRQPTQEEIDAYAALPDGSIGGLIRQH